MLIFGGLFRQSRGLAGEKSFFVSRREMRVYPRRRVRDQLLRSASAVFYDGFLFDNARE